MTLTVQNHNGLPTKCLCRNRLSSCEHTSLPFWLPLRFVHDRTAENFGRQAANRLLVTGKERVVRALDLLLIVFIVLLLRCSYRSIILLLLL